MNKTARVINNTCIVSCDCPPVNCKCLMLVWKLALRQFDPDVDFITPSCKSIRPRTGPAARPCARLHPGAPLQHPHREVVRRLDPALYPLSRATPSAGPGRGARGSVPVLPGHGPAGGRADAEPGAGRLAIPLQERPRRRVAVDGGGCAGQAAAAHPDGPDPG